MIRDRLILCIASNWDYDPTSKHHVMRLLSRHNEVLWVNYHGTRRPRLNRMDLLGSFATLRRVARGVTRISDSMWQVTPLVLPGAKRSLIERVSRTILLQQLRRAVARVSSSRTRPLQLWSFAPDVPGLLGRFGEECSVYYCVDEFSQFQGVDADRIRRAERETLSRADVVVATSQTLLDARRPLRPDAVLMRHGVDFDHFARAWRCPPDLPAELHSIPRPVFGFFGQLEHWIDTRLLENVARSRPRYSFVLIGEPRVDVSGLRSLPNVQVLGRRPYADLPAYAAAFDGALLPFTQTAMTRNVNPIKMLEYLAAGLRIVSTPLPEAVRFSEEVLIAGTAAGFAVACDRLLAEAASYPRYVVARAASEETWTSRVQQLSELVLEYVDRAHAGRTPATREVLVPEPESTALPGEIIPTSLAGAAARP